MDQEGCSIMNFFLQKQQWNGYFCLLFLSLTLWNVVMTDIQLSEPKSNNEVNPSRLKGILLWLLIAALAKSQYLK